MRNRETAILVLVVLAAFIFGTWPTPEASSQNTSKDTLSVDQAQKIIRNNLDTARQNNTKALSIAIDAKKTRVNIEKPVVPPETFKRDLNRALAKEPKVVVEKEPVHLPIPIPIPVDTDSVVTKGGYIYIYQSSPKYGGTLVRELSELEVKGFAGPFGNKRKLKNRKN